MGIVFVNGTNGSGKSTLARTLIEEFGGVYTVYEVNKNSKITVCNNGICVLGEYRTACGGLDGFKSWNDIETCIDSLKQWGITHILAEGVINYGFNHYLDLNQKYPGSVHYLRLATPVKICIEQVKNRRKESGNEKPFDPKNLYKKDKAMYGLYINLIEGGLENCHSLDYEGCKNYILTLFKEESDEHSN